jgi:hypothetical protein
MKSLDTTEPIPPSLCALVDQWLHDNDYEKIQILHGVENCGIASYDIAQNRCWLGHITTDSVILINREDAWGDKVLLAHDPQFFDMLADGLSFAKP